MAWSVFGLWHSGGKNKIAGLEQSLMQGVKDPGKSHDKFCVHVIMTMFLQDGTRRDFQCGLWPLRSTVSHSFSSCNVPGAPPGSTFG